MNIQNLRIDFEEFQMLVGIVGRLVQDLSNDVPIDDLLDSVTNCIDAVFL